MQGSRTSPTYHRASNHDHDECEVAADERYLRRRRLHVPHNLHKESQRHQNCDFKTNLFTRCRRQVESPNGYNG